VSYLRELEQLGAALAALTSQPSMTLDERGVQAALTARKALLGLLHVQLTEAAPLDRRAARADLQTIGDHPVAGLIGAVRGHPRPHSEIAPSELYAMPPGSPDGRVWLEVARRATLAQAEWEGRNQPLASLHEWAVVHEAAALAASMATLDGRLVSAATDAGCDDQVSPLTSESRLMLQTAAREAGALAAQGELVPIPDRSRRIGPMPIPVRSHGDVVPALVTLRAILAQSAVLTPEHARLVAIALARVAHVVEGPSPTMSAATTLTASLRRVATAPQSVACPFAGDRRATIQAGELTRWAQTPSQGSWAGAGATLEHVKKAVAILDRVVKRQLQQGLWLIPEPDPQSAFAWRVWDHSQPMPGLATAVRDAAGNHPPMHQVTHVLEVARGPATRRHRPLSAQVRPAR
jgi:hypothetical protein